MTLKFVNIGEISKSKVTKLEEENIPGNVTQFLRFSTSSPIHLLQQVQNKSEHRLLASLVSHSAHYSITLLNNYFGGMVPFFFFLLEHFHTVINYIKINY